MFFIAGLWHLTESVMLDLGSNLSWPALAVKRGELSADCIGLWADLFCFPNSTQAFRLASRGGKRAVRKRNLDQLHVQIMRDVPKGDDGRCLLLLLFVLIIFRSYPHGQHALRIFEKILFLQRVLVSVAVG
jgi:hypothetical protein